MPSPPRVPNTPLGTIRPAPTARSVSGLNPAALASTSRSIPPTPMALLSQGSLLSLPVWHPSPRQFRPAAWPGGATCPAVAAVPRPGLLSSRPCCLPDVPAPLPETPNPPSSLQAAALCHLTLTKVKRKGHVWVLASPSASGAWHAVRLLQVIPYLEHGHNEREVILELKSDVIILALSPTSPSLLRLTGNTAHHERDVKLASHLRGLASRASTFAPLATRAVNLQHPWLVRIHLAAQNTEASTC